MIAAPAGYYENVRTDVEPLLPSRVCTALEIGCGAGATMAWLRQKRQIEYAAAVEIVAEAASRAEAVFDDVVLGDINCARLEFKRRQFDLILALDVIEHLPDPAAALASLHDHLEPNGTLIVSLPNVAHYHVSLPLFFLGKWEYRDQGLLDRTHMRFFTMSSAVALIQDAGFQVRRVMLKRQFPNVFAAVGLTSQRWRWYSNRILGYLVPWPRHLFVHQILIAAGKT
ncbi:MAG TPA: class I SAM-dependent methyltransferase [Acetobacteraceae bacterium]|nr:class I SAM-dependent methyltransferase [Acetobacteraceae bacterium]